MTAYTGGIGRHNATMAPELVRQGHETHVVTLSTGGPRQTELDGVTLHLEPTPVPRPLTAVEDLAWSVQVDRALRKLGRFDVVFAAEWGGEAWRYAHHKRNGPLITNLATSLAQVLFFAGERAENLELKLRRRIQHRLEQGQTERSDAIASPSAVLLDWARELWRLETIPARVLPNFLNLRRVRRLSEQAPPADFPRDVDTVFFFGRLERRKGVHILAEAMPLVWADRPETHFVLAGDDADVEQGLSGSQLLRRAAGSRVDQLHLLGRLQEANLFAAIASATIVALPSLWESFGIAALEAQALGRPLVATTGSGFEDFCRTMENSLLVPPSDAQALASAITDLLTDRELADRLGARAAAHAEGFAAPTVVARYVDWFEDALGGR